MVSALQYDSHRRKETPRVVPDDDTKGEGVEGAPELVGAPEETRSSAPRHAGMTNPGRGARPGFVAFNLRCRPDGTAPVPAPSLRERHGRNTGRPQPRFTHAPPQGDECARALPQRREERRAERVPASRVVQDRRRRSDRRADEGAVGNATTIPAAAPGASTPGQMPGSGSLSGLIRPVGASTTPDDREFPPSESDIARLIARRV